MPQGGAQVVCHRVGETLEVPDGDLEVGGALLDAPFEIGVQAAHCVLGAPADALFRQRDRRDSPHAQGHPEDHADDQQGGTQDSRVPQVEAFDQGDGPVIEQGAGIAQGVRKMVEGRIDSRLVERPRCHDIPDREQRELLVQCDEIGGVARPDRGKAGIVRYLQLELLQVFLHGLAHVSGLVPHFGSELALRDGLPFQAVQRLCAGADSRQRGCRLPGGVGAMAELIDHDHGEARHGDDRKGGQPGGPAPHPEPLRARLHRAGRVREQGNAVEGAIKRNGGRAMHTALSAGLGKT